MSSNSISLNLHPPGTFVFTAEMAILGHRLNKCALTLKSPASREAFKAAAEDYMRDHGLSETERGLVHARDWTGLLRAGGHIQAILFYAATMGETLFDIGSHNAGMHTAEMMQICPRRVGGLPPSLVPSQKGRS